MFEVDETVCVKVLAPLKVLVALTLFDPDKAIALILAGVTTTVPAEPLTVITPVLVSVTAPEGLEAVIPAPPVMEVTPPATPGAGFNNIQAEAELE